MKKLHHYNTYTQYIPLTHYNNCRKRKNIWKYLFLGLIFIELFLYSFLTCNIIEEEGTYYLDLGNSLYAFGPLY